MKKLNVVVVGCGAIHDIHIEAIKKVEYANLYAVCDRDETRAKQAAEENDCKYYIDFNQMVDDDEVDVIHICTPHYLHGEMVCKAIEKVKHVLTEKPLGMDEEECMRIARKAKESTCKVGVCLQNRYNPTSIALKKIIDEGLYGPMLGMRAVVSWNRGKDYYIGSPWKGKWQYEGGGLLMNQMIHTLDLMQWFGGTITNIRGHVSNRRLEGIIEEEDTAEATLWFDNGVVGSFYATNTYSMNSSVLLEIHLEQAVLRIQDNELTLIKGIKKQILARDYIPETGKSYWGISHANLIQDFYDAIWNNHENYSNVSEGVVGVAMCQKIYSDSIAKHNR